MGINADKPSKWKEDIAQSVDFYNTWFLNFAPKTYRETRSKTILQVESALKTTDYLIDFNESKLKKNPDVLSVLRMATAPPIARDRLIGLSSVSPSLVHSLEDGRLPTRMAAEELDRCLHRISATIDQLLDRDIFTWLAKKKRPTEEEIFRASTVVADRLCGAMSDPIIRNAQEQRQLKVIRDWLEARGYKLLEDTEVDFLSMPRGTFAFRFNIPVRLQGGERTVNIPMDTVVMPLKGKSKFPILIEAKSAGDFTNTNKRRKEEAVKAAQLKDTYGKEAKLLLFLCGYFDSGYLGYEAAEGIDWVWEHRIRDLEKTGL